MYVSQKVLNCTLPLLSVFFLMMKFKMLMIMLTLSLSKGQLLITMSTFTEDLI